MAQFYSAQLSWFSDTPVVRFCSALDSTGPAGNNWTTHHSWRSSSATRSTAALNAASNSGCRAPVSRRPVALEDFDWSASITLDRRVLDAVFSLE